MSRISVRIVLTFVVMSSRIIAAEPGTPSDSNKDVLETILKKWEQARVQRQSVSMKFQLFTYDQTFASEERGTGSFEAHLNQTGDYRVNSSEVPKGSQSRRTDAKGRRYSLKPARSEHWQWRTTFVRTTHEDGLIEEVQFPKESKHSVIDFLGWGSWAMQFRNPFLSPYVFGIPAEELKTRFEISLVKQTDKKIHLRLLPRQKRDQVNFAEVNLLLNSDDYVTMALKTVDPTRNNERLYLFEDVEITRSSHDEFKSHPFCAESETVY